MIGFPGRPCSGMVHLLRNSTAVKSIPPAASTASGLKNQATTSLKSKPALAISRNASERPPR